MELYDKDGNAIDLDALAAALAEKVGAAPQDAGPVDTGAGDPHGYTRPRWILQRTGQRADNHGATLTSRAATAEEAKAEAHALWGGRLSDIKAIPYGRLGSDE